MPPPSDPTYLQHLKPDDRIEISSGSMRDLLWVPCRVVFVAENCIGAGVLGTSTVIAVPRNPLAVRAVATHMPELKAGMAVEVALPTITSKGLVQDHWEEARVIDVTAVGWIKVKTRTGMLFTADRTAAAIRLPAAELQPRRH